MGRGEGGGSAFGTAGWCTVERMGVGMGVVGMWLRIAIDFC